MKLDTFKCSVIDGDPHPLGPSTEKVKRKDDNKTTWNEYLMGSWDHQMEKCTEWCISMKEYFQPSGAHFFFPNIINVQFH
jgi:hypothetical protein